MKLIEYAESILGADDKLTVRLRNSPCANAEISPCETCGVMTQFPHANMEVDCINAMAAYIEGLLDGRKSELKAQ